MKDVNVHTEDWYRVRQGNDFVPTVTKGCSAFEAAYDAAEHYGWFRSDEYAADDRPQDCVRVKNFHKAAVIGLPGRESIVVKCPRGRYASMYRAVFMAVRKVFLDEQK